MQIEKIKTKYNQILTQYIKGDITNVGLVSFLLSFTKQYLGYEEEKYIDKYDIIGDLFALYEHYHYGSPVLKLQNPNETFDRLLSNIEKLVES